MKILKMNVFLSLVLAIAMMSCDNGEEVNPDLSTEQEVSEFESSLNGRSGNSTEEESTEGKSTEEKSTEEKSSEESGVDCSFDGLQEAKARIGHFVGVNEFPNQFGSDTVVEWTINGDVVNPRRPRFVRVNDHVVAPGQVEVCFSAISSDCTVSECTTIDFKG